ncbi:methyltransferase domain-containing protein [Aggregicoccus sp. 17bor-14]|uniref:class I SAM-dependent methyltransferase n=1 Tax=Myxococcaceae TaxID=31 RepID=UPI00129C2094|nr:MULTISPECIES: methyltransferase domain-containing protein [Myxococcaceae]MBF5042148.1 methyltransferase domain-containing protein [Simulacricoccus sp. 17bor-14]MRI87925.1 methyltransferase domain-containing protein [Aggregicoccus sp. 17bor-14]
MSEDPHRQVESTWARTVDAWRQYDELEARLTRPVSERMLELARLTEGMHVLDVACGRGEPALPAAHRVGPQGRVLGVDLIEGMLPMARERAAREGLTNVEFRAADAESLQLPERFDVATVRWGLMYMAAPERALQSIHRALKPGGALVIASWAEPERVPYAVLPRQVLARFRDVPPLPSEDAPGAFRYADPARLTAALERTGFHVEASEELEVPVVEAPDAAGILTWLRTLNGPVVKLAAELPEPQRRAWEDALCAELEKSRRGDRVTLGGVTRLTLARSLEP